MGHGKGKILLAVFLTSAALFTAAYFIPFFSVRCLIRGHVPGNEIIIDKEANCSEEGSGHRICTVCGRKAVKVKISKRAIHSFEDGVCSVCGAKDPSYTDGVPGGALFRAKTLYEIRVRRGPGTDYDALRVLPPGSIVDVYETKTSGGYSWNRIGENEWIANDGSWLEKVE